MLLDLSDKINQLKQIEDISPFNLLNHLVRAKLKKSLICKILLKEMSYIINQNVEKFIILMNILF